MTRYLFGEMYRTFRRRYLYLTVGICALILFAIMMLFVTANRDIPDPAQRMHLDMLLMFFVQFLPSIGLYFTLLIGDMTFSEEHKIQTMRNTVFYGTPRITIYLGKFANCLFFCFAVMVALLAVAFGLGAALLGGPGAAFGECFREFMMMLAGAIPLWVAGAALSTALFCNIQSPTMVTLAFCGAFILPTNFLKLVNWLLNVPAAARIRELLITSRLDELSSGAASAVPAFLATCWVTGLAFTAAFLILGFIGFGRKEIK